MRLGAAANWTISLILAAMVVIPLAESLLRPTLGLGIPGSATIVQNLTLLVGMVGGAIAARENRLLSMATASTFLKGRWLAAANIYAYAFAAAISLFLATAGAQYVVSEREAGRILVYGIPVWMVEAALPAGFLMVALGLLWHSAATYRARLIAVVLAAAIGAIGIWPPVDPSHLRVPALLLLLGATICGGPIFAALGGAALILFWSQGQTIASLAVDHYRLVVNPSFPTIPLFTLAGYFLAEGGSSKRLVRVFLALFGRFRGGPAIVTALVCAFFTTFTGASGVTILALGGLLMPILRAARYPERAALGLLTGAGSLGLLFPPCLPVILYAIIAKINMEQMFLGGVLPGILLVGLTIWWGMRQNPEHTAGTQPFELSEAKAALWSARWELLFPAVAMVSLFAGFATPVEAAALTALYAFVAEAVLHRSMTVKHAVRVMTECGLLIGGVLLILGVALGFVNFLVDAEIPSRGVEWVTASIHSPLMFLLLLNVFLLVVGALMDIFSAIIIVVPLIVPLGAAFGINPIHLGIIFLANMELGYLTPPVGMNLFLASYRLKIPMPEVYRAVVPMLVVLLVGVLLITYIPPMTTVLPRLFAR